MTTHRSTRTARARATKRNARTDPSAYHDRTVRAIRRIIRAVDIFSRRLQTARGVTVPQLSCLVQVVKTQQVTLTALAQAADLSASTTVGIVDRLERQELVTRVRSDLDRRQVLISPTRKGVALVKAAPSPLQDRLAAALDELPELEQAAIALSLERIVDLMGIEEMDASPILDTGASLRTDAVVDKPPRGRSPRRTRPAPPRPRTSVG